MTDKKIMLGNEAFARGAYEAGVKVISSYPGTPSTEVTEFATAYDEMYVEWAPNEKVALEVSVGASLAGVRALSCMKHVGLNVAADPLFTVAYTGVNAGLVVLVADDAGCHSSQNEQDSRYYARAAGVPMLEPSTAQECKDFMKMAFALSEENDLPFLVRSNTRISHSRGIVGMENRIEPEDRPYEKNVQKNVSMPAVAIQLHKSQEKRINRLQEAAGQMGINCLELRDTRVGVITSGVAYEYVREALPEVSTLKLGLIYPLSRDLILKFAKQVDELYVIEEGEPFLETEIKAMGFALKGKELFSIQGEYSVNMIKKAFGKDVPEATEKQEVPARPPLLCAGCPHRAVFYILNRLGKTVTGDIGCYTLGAVAPLAAMDTTLCMGASIPMAHGMEKAKGKDYAKNVVAVIGDSTFFHSGMTGLVNMRYNGSSGTVMVLDNRITGMTGHQDNPSTGKNAKGEPAPAIDIAAIVKAIGIEHVYEVDPLQTKELTELIKRETARDELSVIIAKRPCQLIVKEQKPPFAITDACRKCGTCMRIGCPAIEKHEDTYVIIKERCVGCGLCAEVCPFGAIKEVTA